MIVRNFLEAPYQIQSVHDGKGVGKNAKVFSAEEFDTPLKFIYYTQMEPGASIGVHPHGENEEVYVVLSGAGIMTVNDERQPVKTGDIIVNNEKYVQRYSLPVYYETAERVNAHAQARGLAPATLAVAWVMSHPTITAPIIGARNVEQLQASLAALDVKMTPEWRAEISALSVEPPPATDRLEEQL